MIAMWCAGAPLLLHSFEQSGMPVQFHVEVTSLGGGVCLEANFKLALAGR